MKLVTSIFLLLALAFAAAAADQPRVRGIALAATAADKPRVSRAALDPLEKSLDARVSRQWDDNSYGLLGSTRGVYLEGYGVVFTAEVNLVTATGITPFHPTISKQDIERQHQKKLERLPQLKALLREALVASAASLDTMPPDQQIVIVAFLWRYPWEDSNGVPVRVTMQASRQKLLEAQHAGSASLDNLIRVATEY